MKRKEPKQPESAISREEAEWLDRVNDLTARAMVEWLKAGTDVRKPIDSLKKEQLIALAELVRGTYVVARSLRRGMVKDKSQEQLDLEGLWA